MGKKHVYKKLENFTLFHIRMRLSSCRNLRYTNRGRKEPGRQFYVLNESNLYFTFAHTHSTIFTV
jgi:hypothetical protein